MGEKVVQVQCVVAVPIVPILVEKGLSSRVMTAHDQAMFDRLPVGISGSLRWRGRRELSRNQAGGP